MFLPRPEYPRPQFVRSHWLNLNGTWDFQMDFGDSGLERGLLSETAAWPGTITVPFCPESTLSGIGYTDFMDAVWYRRSVTVPNDPAWQDKRVLLHFQAVDYDATVWVNAKEVYRHRGGFTSFTADLGVRSPGETFTLTVRARDDHRLPGPHGKQSQNYANAGCHYTRTTGIWQTVWMEPVSKVYLKRPRITPDVANGAFHLELPVSQNRSGYAIQVTLKDAAGAVVSAATRADLDFAGRLTLAIPKDRVKLWGPGAPHLYDLDIELLDADKNVVDRARSYAGLRSVSIDGKAVKINGKTVFQRLVLDQGYYSDGLMTAPTDEHLLQDIKLSIAAGFNGARLHQKVFEERFYYHADRLGYLCWGEFGDWGIAGFGPSHDHQQPSASFITQWLEALERDYSHPSIVGWCGLNETHQRVGDRIVVLDDVTRGMFLAAKAMDTSRPVLDASGYSHRLVESDVWDSHDYVTEHNWEEGLAKFKQRHESLVYDKPHTNDPSPEQPISTPYNGSPFFVSEFGGIWWNEAEAAKNSHKHSWGYGGRPKTIEEFHSRFQALCDTLLDNPHMFGYCYTQLTDVFQEENGIFNFDRSAKFDLARIAKVQTRIAAIEKAAGAH